MSHLNDTEKIFLGVFTAPTAAEHEHDFLELVYLAEGEATHIMNGEKMKIKKGNYFIIDYNTKHSYCQTGKTPLKIINCLFLPDFVDKTLKKCRKFEQVMENYLIHYSFKSLKSNPANIIFFDDSGKIRGLIENMLSEYENKQPGYIEILRCMLIEIIIETVRKFHSENDFVCDSIEKYISDYINENYMKKITLREISAKLNYSVPYLSKIFHKKYGTTFENYLQKTRMEQSCRLLANTDKKIIEIAECVGYSDIKFFTDVFKRFMQIPPREYRKLHR